MSQIIIGRRGQTKELEEAYSSHKPEMVALVGRRRVGKTYVVRETYKGKIDFELTGIQYGTKQEQLLNFSLSMKTYFPLFEMANPPTDWITAFHLLTEALNAKKKKTKMVVFLDELPWLGTKRSGFIKGLGYLWNSWAVKQNIVVVTCGSAASWMIRKVINDKGGLHNRVTRLLFLHPFTLKETEAYCKSRKIKLNRFQILQIYMTMGGIPMYLDQLKKEYSAIQNIKEICFSPSGYLKNEFNRLFASLFENHEKHIEIVRALASKRKGLTRNEIIEITSFKNGGNLTEVLNDLDQSGFIEIYGSFEKRTKGRLYRLTDAYSLFYLTFMEKIAPNANIDFNELSDLPTWNSWSGYTFDNVCLSHVEQIKNALGIKGIYSTTSTFNEKATTQLPGAQIDSIIDRNDQSINICEKNFSKDLYTLMKAEVDKIVMRKRVFQHHSKTKKHLFTTMITPFGIASNAHKINYIDQQVTLDDLYE